MSQVSYLIGFIKCLIENDNKQILEDNKKQLKEEYIVNSAKLNKNLGDKYEQVSDILQVYRFISERVKKNKSGTSEIKQNLYQCKRLLQYKKEDLRRLWIELVEKRNCVKLLEALESIKIAPDLITKLTEDRQWFEATLVVYTSNKLIANGLSEVPLVLPIRSDLMLRQKSLIEHLKSNLNKMVFEEPLTEALRTSATFGERNEKLLEKKLKKFYGENTNNYEPSNRLILEVPQQFKQLALLNSWCSVKIYNKFWDDKAETMDIKTVSLNYHNKHPKDKQGLNQLVVDCGDKLLRDENYQDILDSICSLHQLSQLQNCLNEWNWKDANSALSNNINGNGASEENTGLNYIRRQIFKLIVIKATEQIKRSAMSQNDTRLETYEDCRYLLELLDLLYSALYQCQSSLLLLHKTGCYLIKSKKSNAAFNKHEDIKLFFDQDAIRKIIQNEIIALLNAHFQTDKSHHSTATVNSNTMNWPSPDVLKHYMGKKKGIFTNVASNLSQVGTVHTTVHLSTENNSVSLTMGVSNSHHTNHNAPGGVGSSVNANNSSKSHSEKPALFKFSNSSHALSVSACLREMRPITYNIDEFDKSSTDMKLMGKDYLVVCKPSHNNITQIFHSIMDFIELLEVEELMSNNKDISEKKPCQLRIFIHNFIENVFLKQSEFELDTKLNSIFSEDPSGPFKGLLNLVSQANERDLGLQRPIIALMLTADSLLEEMKRVTMCLRHYALGYLQMCYRVLERFQHNLNEWFKQLAQSDTNNAQDLPHMSTEWGKDADLIRFWKNMPSWQNMMSIDIRENLTSHVTSSSGGGCSGSISLIASGMSGQASSANDTSGGLFSMHNGTMGGITDSSVITNLTSSGILGNQERTTNISSFAASSSWQQYNNRHPRFNSTGEADDASDEVNSNSQIDTANSTLLKERQARLLVNEESRHDLRLIQDEVKSILAQQTKQKSIKGLTPGFVTFRVFHKMDLIKLMARLHESMAWFNLRLNRFINWLNSRPWLKPIKEEQIVLTEDEDKQLSALLHQFELLNSDMHDLSDSCLMSLHMEGRIRAYNCIIRLPYEANYTLQLDEADVDQQISELIKSLNEMEFALTHTLTRHKFRFVFEGLGNFMSALFVQILQKIKSMSPSGIKKMCRNIYKIHQTLTLLTNSHEMDLVRVRQLYELIHLQPENVVQKIMDQGAVYEEEVYDNILQIYQHSNPLYNNDRLKASRIRLKEVINMEYV